MKEITLNLTDQQIDLLFDAICQERKHLSGYIETKPDALLLRDIEHQINNQR
jgi:hypothetical protein